MKTDGAQILARSLMGTHGLAPWKFEFDRSVRRFGACHWRTKTITMSKALTEANDMVLAKDRQSNRLQRRSLLRQRNQPSGSRRTRANSPNDIACDIMDCFIHWDVHFPPQARR